MNFRLVLGAFLAAALAGAAVLAASPAGTGGDPVFKLRPEWKGPVRRAGVVDVDLGNSPESFVRAAYAQVFGKRAPEKVVRTWAGRLKTDPRLRRVDLVRIFCMQAGRDCRLRYSVPWLNDPDLDRPFVKKARRDIGAVIMFFFHCPGGVNCGMDWANTHAWGMDSPSPGLGFGAKPEGYYTADNPGFWRRELRDAKYAGLQFLMPNVYGPDLRQGQVKTLAQALEAESDPVKIALFDDTWAWGEKWFGPFWQAAPDLSHPEAAAEKLYQAKWKPFFSQVPREDWYLLDGRPFIYFYNANKLMPIDRSAAVLKRMKEMFRKDFGVEPFVVVDRGYFQDPAMPGVADSQFVWSTLDSPQGFTHSDMGGHSIDTAMVKWDSVGRDHPGALPRAGDRLIKGPELLEKVLAETRGAQVLVLATWNDLGEGTGINLNYDYYYLGRWLRPDFFMNLVRESQER